MRYKNADLFVIGHGADGHDAHSVFRVPFVLLLVGELDPIRRRLHKKKQR